jgi:hypothetical protein
MSRVCHTCPWWVEIEGRNPQSQERVDRWDCTIAFLPSLLIENSAQQRSTAAAVETVTVEMQKTEAQSSATITTLMNLVNNAMHQAAATALALERATDHRQLENGASAPKQIAQ